MVYIFFDLLIWIFGDVKDYSVTRQSRETVEGNLNLEHAHVRWLLSIDNDQLPDSHKRNNLKSSRSLIIDGKAIEFGNGFDDLHTMVYKEILKGNGIPLTESIKTIQLVHNLRKQLNN